jgi:hypothetical protein
MYQKLVANGCSYSELYCSGDGHVDLANRLGIPIAETLAIGGSANSRIIRSTLKHSYQTAVPTFYVIGATFLSRNEITILDDSDKSEGRWTNPQNQQFKKRWIPEWTQRDTDRYVELKLKADLYSILDRLEDLQYRWLSMIADLHSRGHGCIVYQQGDDLHLPFMDDSRVALFSSRSEFVGGYRWRAIAWQHAQGVPAAYDRTEYNIPDDMKHPRAGEHDLVNQYLTEYIKTNSLI